jgi:hypothetical protein
MTQANDRASEFGERLSAFARHKEELIAMLRKEYESNGNAPSFDGERAWYHLQGAAVLYIDHDAGVNEQRSTVPASERVDKLLELGNALRVARQTADEVMPVVGCHLFVEWCEANGNPDLTDPVITQYETAFSDLVAGLTALEDAAFRAAEYVRKRPGPLSGTSILPHHVILQLESTYREITKREAGAGRGPFARFVMKFLNALGRSLAEGSAEKAIKAAKKREESNPALSEWGRSLLFEALGGKFPPKPE